MDLRGHMPHYAAFVVGAPPGRLDGFADLLRGPRDEEVAMASDIYV